VQSDTHYQFPPVANFKKPAMPFPALIIVVTYIPYGLISLPPGFAGAGFILPKSLQPKQLQPFSNNSHTPVSYPSNAAWFAGNTTCIYCKKNAVPPLNNRPWAVNRSCGSRRSRLFLEAFEILHSTFPHFPDFNNHTHHCQH
jgi:hypothetical protein